LDKSVNIIKNNVDITENHAIFTPRPQVDVATDLYYQL